MASPMIRVGILAVGIAVFPTILFILFFTGQKALLWEFFPMLAFVTAGGTFGIVSIYRDYKKHG